MDTRIDGSILSGKIVLLTGAGGGIGLEAAKAFAEMGGRKGGRRYNGIQPGNLWMD